MKEKIFTKLFEEAEIAKFTPKELKEYEDSLKAYRDIKNSLDTALEKGRAEGREEGRAEGKLEVAQKMMAAKLPIEMITQMTGLSEEEIRRAANV